MTAADDLDEILAWREVRTVTHNLTLHYDRLMLLLDPTPFARGLVRKKVDVVNYPDGRFAIQFEGTSLPFRVFNKIQTVQPGAFVENKRLGAALAMLKEQQAASRRTGGVMTRHSSGRRITWKHRACRQKGGLGAAVWRSLDRTATDPLRRHHDDAGWRCGPQGLRCAHRQAGFGP